MGKCRLCGRSAGLFARSHAACRAKDEVRATTFPAVLGALEAGVAPPIDLTRLPVRFDDDERPVWFWSNVGKLDHKIQRRYVGSSAGLSVRVAKGVTLRTGGSQGGAVDEEVSRITETGLLILTTRALYYVGSRKTQKIALDDCLSCHVEGGMFSIDTRSFRYNFVPELIAESGDIEALCRTLLSGTERPSASPWSEIAPAAPVSALPVAGLADAPATPLWPRPGLARTLALVHAVPAALFGLIVMAATANGQFSFGQWLSMAVLSLALLSLLLALPALLHAGSRPYARRVMGWSALAFACGVVLVVIFPLPDKAGPSTPVVQGSARAP